MSLEGHRAGLAPFSCYDGRIYDVTNLTVEEGRRGGYDLCCTMDLLERQGQYNLDFIFQFYPEAFERGLCEREPQKLVAYARAWIEDWLDEHPEAHSYFEAGRPLIIDCR